jgi:hypothetical protein
MKLSFQLSNYVPTSLFHGSLMMEDVANKTQGKKKTMSTFL